MAVSGDGDKNIMRYSLYKSLAGIKRENVPPHSYVLATGRVNNIEQDYSIATGLFYVYTDSEAI